jgi:outer membrane protein OmpA-like peptidoglycan-associated protein
VISYGEGRPLVQGQNEGAWSRNRRGEFQVRSGLADG